MATRNVFKESNSLFLSHKLPFVLMTKL